MAFSVPIITGTGDVCPDCGREIELSVVNTTARDGFFVTAFCFCGQRGRVSRIFQSLVQAEKAFLGFITPTPT